MTTTERNTAEREIRREMNMTGSYNMSLGTYITTSLGDFCLTARPNIYQPIDSRTWDFMQTTDSDGEPMTAGETVRVKA